MDQTINPFSNGVTQAIWNGVPPNYIGSHGALITDVTTGYLYQKSGGIWNLVCNKGVVVLSQSAVPASVTGTTAETVLATIAIPAGAVAANGAIRLSALFQFSNSSDTYTPRIKLGSTVYYTGAITGGLSLSVNTIIRAANSTSAQIGFGNTLAAGFGLSTAAPTTSSLDMTQSQSINITGQLGTSGDTMTLIGYSVEVLNP